MQPMSTEAKAQLEQQKKNCIFCQIVEGNAKSSKIYEDSLMIGVLDINPCVKGHVVLLPKEHYPIMPLLPPATFKHLFGTMPKLVDSVKRAMLSSGCNVFIANGAVAGQQSQHFLVHLIPRENNDGLDKFYFGDVKEFDEKILKETQSMLANNLPLMMKNHLGKNPAEWHTGNIKTASFLSDIKKNQFKVYEDEKVLCVFPKNPQCMGHLEIYSNDEEKLFENLDLDSASHMFYAASFCATAVFEGLKAQGSNIILKTGVTDDNPSGILCVHVLARFENDGLDLINLPMQDKPNFEEVSGKIKDYTFLLENSSDEEENKVIDLDARKIEEITDKPRTNKKKSKEPSDEITDAIEKLKQ